MSQQGPIDPSIEPLDEGAGVCIHDPIEGAQFKLFTVDPVDLAPVDPSEFRFPVEAAVSFRASGVIVPKLLTLHVRSTDGEFLSTYDPSQGGEVVETGPRIVQLSTAPMALYLEVPGGLTVRRHEETVIVSFDGQPTVRLGVRSFHESPAATIQVTDDPADVMAALSYFGSALQTLSPERSFGTLRGHPPALERGESLEIPDVLDRPETGVTIEVPPDLEYVYPAAPLAFYLGATVEPGEVARLRCGDFVYPLAGEDGYQAAVHDAFQHVFFMDCITRTEGIYRVDLHERRQLEATLAEPVDFEALYDAPLADRVQRYLELPVEELESLRPTWHLCTDVVPGPEAIESLPFVVSELPLVRCPYTKTAPSKARLSADRIDPDERKQISEDLESFVRSPDAWDDSGGTTPPLPEEAFNPPEVTTMEHEWLGPGIPLATNKATPETYRRRQESTPEPTEHITIDVVCNDPEMEGESVVEEYYGIRDLVTFDVSIYYDLDCEDLTTVLERPSDLLHYIGHVDEDGFRCSDGSLDARTLQTVGCRTFLLNACTSYNQGQALIEGGSYGGVVTITDVGNRIATMTGRTIARLLNAGFTLRSALSITNRYHPTGQQYIVLGDGGVSLVQSESAAPNRIVLRRTPEANAEFEFDYHAYPASSFEIGMLSTIHIEESTANYLPFGYLDTFQTQTDELEEFLSLQTIPVEFNGQLLWSDVVDLDELGSVNSTSISGDGSSGLR